MQVDASEWPNETQVERKSKTCVDLRVRLAKAWDCITFRKCTLFLCFSNGSGFTLASRVTANIVFLVNTPRLLGLYGENIGPPGLGSRERGLPRTQLITYLSSSDYSSPVITLHYCQKRISFSSSDNPSELQGEGTSAQFIFLALIVKECTSRSTEHTHTAQDDLAWFSDGSRSSAPTSSRLKIRLRMTPINEDKQRHLHKPLKILFSYDTKIERDAHSITVERESLNILAFFHKRGSSSKNERNLKFVRQGENYLFWLLLVNAWNASCAIHGKVTLANESALWKRLWDSTVKLLWWKWDVSQKQKRVQFLRTKLISKL